MKNSLVPRSVIATLLVVAIALPVAQGVLYWVGNLLAAMGDTAGEALVARTALVLAVVWLLDFVGLVLIVAINSLREFDE